MLDLQVLPTQALGLPNLPTALAQVSLGEQVARAYAPAGGVVCRTSEQPAPPPAPNPQGRPLAYTTMAYKTIPLFWTGTAMLLIGVVLVAALPRVRMLAPVGPRVGAAGDEPEGPDAGTPDVEAELDTPEAEAETHSTEAVPEEDSADAEAEPEEGSTEAELEANDPEAKAESAESADPSEEGPETERS
jgi:hypothetical protein